MDQLRKATYIEEQGETLLERAVRRELMRMDMMRTGCSSLHTAETSSIPAAEPKKTFRQDDGSRDLPAFL